MNEFIQEQGNASNYGHVRDVEHVPVEPKGVQGVEVRHTADQNPVDGVADGPADDETQGPCHGAAVPVSSQPNPKRKRGQDGEGRKSQLPGIA